MDLLSELELKEGVIIVTDISLYEINPGRETVDD